MTTRLIGAIIMTHGDNNGLVLPPAVAPIQAVIIPVQQHKEGVLDEARKLYDTLKAAGIRVKIDDSENSPGWKFAEYEMKGVPVTLSLVPRISKASSALSLHVTTEKRPLLPLTIWYPQSTQSLKRYATASIRPRLKTVRDAHMPAQQWTRSLRLLKKRATALSRLCGAAKRLARTR